MLIADIQVVPICHLVMAFKWQQSRSRYVMQRISSRRFLHAHKCGDKTSALVLRLRRRSLLVYQRGILATPLSPKPRPLARSMGGFPSRPRANRLSHDRLCWRSRQVARGLSVGINRVFVERIYKESGGSSVVHMLFSDPTQNDANQNGRGLARSVDD
jgi:hypothetical protein